MDFDKGRNMLVVGLVVAAIMIVLLYYFDKMINSFIKKNFKERDLGVIARHLDFDQELFMSNRVEKLNKTSVLLILYPLSSFNINILIIILSLLIIQFKFPYFKAKAELKKQIDQIKLDFPIWIRQLQVLMQIHTVVNALEISQASAPPILKKDIEILVNKLKVDPLSVDSYTDFLNYLPLVDIKRAMKMLYRYSIIGQDDAYGQFNRFISLSTKLLREQRVSDYDSRLFSYQWLAIVPLFSVTVLFMVLMTSYIIEILTKGGI